MMTPRRLLLLVLGFVVCLGAYQVYSFFLGHYDGLPPLPPEYRYSSGPSTAPQESIDTFVSQKHETDKLLEKAFGPKCPELSRNRKIEIGKQDSRTVLAFDEWTLEDGVLRMTKVSLANFKKVPGQGAQPEKEEIVTMQGDVAVVKFDQPIKNLFEIKKDIKPVEGHIEGDEIKLTHNHGTPERNDDITIWCKQRIDFVDEQRRIWSKGKVLVVYAEPMEARFEGVGLEITLANELVPKNANPKTDKVATKKDMPLSIQSVKSVRLEKEVEFTFLKLQGSFLGGDVGKNDPKTEIAPAAAQPMVIRCKDDFVYDVASNTATFQSKVNAIRNRVVQTASGPKQQYDELDADERLVLVLQPPASGKKPKNDQAIGLDAEVQQFELKKAIATGSKVKITANEDGQGNGLHAEGIELICDNVTHEARLRGKDQVVAQLMEYDIIAQGLVKILLPTNDSEDKDPRGLIINGPGEVRLRPSAAHPDPYTLASWQRELQWHRTPTEHRIELQGSAVLMHEKQGRMAGDQVKAWLTPQERKPAANNKAPGNVDSPLLRMDARLKRVEVDQRVSVLSSKLIIPQANRLVLQFLDAPESLRQLKPAMAGERPGTEGNTRPDGANLLGKPENKPAAPAASSPPLYVNANEIEADVLYVSDNVQLVKRVEAREQVHIERKSEPGKQNGIDVHGQRLEMMMQGDNELYRVKLFGNKATLSTDKFGLEGQEIDLDQAENRVTIPGPGKFRFLTDRDFQGNMLVEGRDLQGNPLKDAQGNIKIKPEEVTFIWDKKMEFGGRAALFLGSVLAEKGDVTLSCHSMTITLDRAVSLSGKEEDPGKQLAGQTVALESVVCVSDTQGGAGQRVNPVVIEQRIKPGTPDRHILRIEGVQVVFDNSQKDHEIIKVYGPGEINLVRAGKNQLFEMNGNPPAGNGANNPAAPNTALQLKLTRVLFEQEMEFKKSEGKLRFWRNVRTFHVPGDDINMPLDEKRMPKEGVYLACDKMEIDSIRGPANSTMHEMKAEGNTEMRANVTSYVKADLLTYSEVKGQVVMQGLGSNDALFYNQERPGAPFQVQRAKAFTYDLKTGEFKADLVRSTQIK